LQTNALVHKNFKKLLKESTYVLHSIESIVYNSSWHTEKN